MSWVEILFNLHLVSAAIVYTIAVPVALFVLAAVRARLPHPVLLWNWDKVVTPLGQVILVLLFLGLAYPVIFGAGSAPPLGALLGREELRVSKLINLLFLVALALPLLPIIGRWPALVLPVQGCAAVMLMFSWLAADAGLARVSYWPGPDTAALLLLLAGLTHWLADAAARLGTDWLRDRYRLADTDWLIYNCAVIYLQTPLILLYSIRLGRQLPGTL